MKVFCMLFALALGAIAQTITATGPATAKPGSQVTISVNIAKLTGVSALQWNLGATPATTMAGTVGSVANTASKVLASNTNNNIHVLYGMNATVLPDGEIARYTFTMPAGPISINLANPEASSATGSAVTVNAGAALVINISKNEDINGDGKIDVTDVSLTIDQIQGRTNCGTADINGDGRCSVRDLQLVVNAMSTTP